MVGSARQLSKQFKLRAVTCNLSKPAAQALQGRGVEAVKGDLYDKELLKDALRDAHTVFGPTFTSFDDSLYAKEITQGKHLAGAALDAGVQYIIFTTLCHAGNVCNGKYQDLDLFNVKADIEKYIRSLSIKSAFFAPSMFYQDFYMFYLSPHPQDDGTFAIFDVVSPQSVFPFFDVGDTGKFVGAVCSSRAPYI
ncbi:NmrA-like domain-containing protein [Lobosporangium transversale]|uniref:NmrA-like domain-containing protein n=1 Tax=Lobosporangium transversale TaxID=64571 RepID=A0A1Y2H1P8_9FUNG|nr:NmrA-like domain-containing protein [Lobosporangium transversale]ORZ27921.1 NmrA-like domain-containing protein [Lobosporangium transversale]|eukprot:XP_021885624.1 NmrA-like domain-containing protein [Lobosporangium transversale]